jgi:hypothetical protein
VTLEEFAEKCGLSSLGEVQKSCHLAFYHLKREAVTEFSASDAARWLDFFSLPKPNTSRLAGKLKQSGDTVAGTRQGLFRLHHNYLKVMDAKYLSLSEKSQVVEDHGTILPESLYGNTRGYIENLAKQINRSYEENIFDGCAVLMRRLEEVLLVLSYEHLGIQATIKDGSDNYFLLERIVSDAANNPKLGLSRNSKKDMDTFRELGNYSAHKVTYTCKREFIKEKIDAYRALVDELLHKAGIRT